jgi:hypothetical protein
LYISAGFTLVLLVPLTLLSARFFRDATENRQINSVVSTQVATMGAELIDLNVVQQGDALHMTVPLRVSRQLSYQDVVNMQENIALQLQQPVSIVVNQVVAAQIDPVVPPTFTITPTAATFTPTVTFTPSATATYTPSPTPIPPTATATPQLAQIPTNAIPTLALVQQPGGPSIGVIRPGDFVTVLYETEIHDGLVWWQVRDADGRIGWLPQVEMVVVTHTSTPTSTPTVTFTPGQ